MICNSTVKFKSAAKQLQIGGASVLASRPPPHRSLAGPDEVEDSSFERPVFDALAQILSDWILLHIEPFLGVALAIAQAMMPAARLKLPFRWGERWGERTRELFVFQRELALPVGNPRLNRESQIVWRAETVKMIRHQQIIAHEPSLRFRPGLMQKPVCGLICQPEIAFVGGHCQQHDIRLAEVDVNARRGISSLGKFVVVGIGHGRKLQRS